MEAGLYKQEFTAEGETQIHISIDIEPTQSVGPISGLKIATNTKLYW